MWGHITSNLGVGGSNPSERANYPGLSAGVRTGADCIVRHRAVGKAARNGYLGDRRRLCASTQATAPAIRVTSQILDGLQQLVTLTGYWTVGLILRFESLRLPLPGESIL